ncbi:MAG TPA: NUDIX hydrolase [Chloroflexota bacterium]|nr:NUDIX hydrolase [Chloroflexota bacterium]
MSTPSPQAIQDAIRLLESAIDDPRVILPEEIFLFISRLIPLANVDLLIKDDQGRTLLTWRDDLYFGPGWHIPGSTIRFKERIADRVRACARDELGAEVSFDPQPIHVQEVILPEPERTTRGHCLALLYHCTLLTPPDPTSAYTSGTPSPGQWAWHAAPPEDLLPVHRVYERFL